MNTSIFLRKALNIDELWSPSHVLDVGLLSTPDLIFGPRHVSIIKGDLHALWANWFLESIVDPIKYSGYGKTYADIYADVFHRVKNIFTNATKSERDEIAKFISELVHQRVKALRLRQKRKSYSLDTRLTLVEQYQEKPRCWICGFLFADDTCDAFINSQTALVSHRHQFVDVYKPLGLDLRDAQIEIDHVVPHSAGGGDGENLRLACGWCNRHKGAYSSLYDVGGSPLAVRSAAAGIHSLPRKFWIVRLLGLVQRCEHPSGCSAEVSNAELTIEPIDELGVPNPTNLRVVCGRHHRLGHNRLMPIEVVRKIWKE